MKLQLSLTLLFTLVFFGAYSQSDDIVDVGDQAPAFTYTSTDGTISSLKDLSGKVVLINFFATWCKPCVAEMPHLEELYSQWKDNDQFVLLSVGREHNVEEVMDFKTQKGISFTMCADETKEIYSKFASKYIPRNYLIDKNGVIVYMSTGFSEEEFKKMKGVIESML